MKKIFILMLLCVAVMATSCCKNSDEDSDEVVATGVTIDQQTLTLAMEQSVTLTATVMPEDADDRSVTWSSSDESVATVSDEGKVKTHKAGTATITATSNSGGLTATCVVTVSNETYVGVKSVSINKGILNLTVGAKETLVATVKPNNATTKNVTWASQNEAIATVSAIGEVTAVALGTTTVSVVTLDGEYSDVCEVKVEEATVVGFENEGQPGIDGSSWEKAYEIANKEQLILLSTRCNNDYSIPWAAKYYKLTANINFGSTNTAVWIPINNNLGFSGHFDGGDHVIEGRLVAAASLSQNFGLFGYVKDGEIKNLHFKGDIDISAVTATEFRTGAIAGQFAGTATVTNCTNTASISGNGNIGGIAGYASGTSKVIACQNSGNMTSKNQSVGGITSMASGALVVGCINKGTTMTVANVSEKEYAGGIVASGEPIACWSVATSITGNTERIGAITGRVFSTANFIPKHCYWNPIDGVKGVGGGTGEKNYSSFNGTHPTLQMSSDMNNAWKAELPDTKFGFNENGQIVPMP